MYKITIRFLLALLFISTGSAAYSSYPPDAAAGLAEASSALLEKISHEVTEGKTSAEFMKNGCTIPSGSPCWVYRYLETNGDFSVSINVAPKDRSSPSTCYGSELFQADHMDYLHYTRNLALISDETKVHIYLTREPHDAWRTGNWCGGTHQHLILTQENDVQIRADNCGWAGPINSVGNILSECKLSR